MARTPQLTDINIAVKKYYEKIELSNADIRALFGVSSSRTVCKLKDMAKNEMVKQGKQSWNPHCVNTETAYLAWGLDIADLERRREKLIKLNKQ